MKINSWLAFTIITMIPLFSFAEGAHFLISGIGESLMERDQNQDIVGRNLTGYNLGLGFENYVFIAEYSTFRESTGANALIVDRLIENYSVWALWVPNASSSLIPFIGAGLGQSIETIDTTLLGTTSQDRGRPQFLGSGCFGLKANMPSVWISGEVRVMAAEHWDPNPSIGFLGRMGFFF
jgi:hypothetical protein